MSIKRYITSFRMIALFYKGTKKYKVFDTVSSSGGETFVNKWTLQDNIDRRSSDDVIITFPPQYQGNSIKSKLYEKAVESASCHQNTSFLWNASEKVDVDEEIKNEKICKTLMIFLFIGLIAFAICYGVVNK